ncbi:MAG: flagellar hook-basal body complex protein, partial [Hyphomicrobiales bacterium]|nr:flagellar hook-basal body complex protein [Hyphomicrobiales bacterium]
SQQPAAAALPPAITFDPTGVPSAFGVTDISITGFANGAGDMDGSDSPPITLDFGTIGLSDGFSQLGDTFSPGSIEQNGARFGTFSGVSIGDDGLVYALFDNGERRPIYQMPVVTFVNPNELNAATGNAWLATEASGNPTLRVPSDGPAGSIIQSSLESSTVDIGDEFTRMIIVQRAYSAATRIISTSDEMLEELVRIKR